MHVQSMFTFDDEAAKIAFMKKYSFATIVTNKESIPIATQLPFIIRENAGKLILSGHFGVANEQVRYIENNTSLIIFTEPHAYIDPSITTSGKVCLLGIISPFTLMERQKSFMVKQKKKKLLKR